MPKKNILFLFISALILSSSMTGYAQSRFGISVSGGKLNLFQDGVDSTRSSDLGFEGELEFFFTRSFSFFLNGGQYKFSEQEGLYNFEQTLIPVVNGLRLHTGSFYIGYSLGFLIVKQKYILEYFSSPEEITITTYHPGGIWVSGFRINVSHTTSLHFYGKYAIFKDGYKFWSWGVGLAPSH